MKVPDRLAEIRALEDLVARQDRWRLRSTVNLIASENVLSRRARALMKSDFQHRYAEGHPGDRYYNGTALIDEVETKVEATLRALFRCGQVEVRTISGTVANDVAISTLLPRDAPAVVNSTPAGGHISHQSIGAVGKYTKEIHFLPATPDGMRTDAAAARDLIAKVRPKLVILGKSLFLFPEPVREVAEVCRAVDARLLYDGAHVLGLIAGGAFQDPLAEGAELLTGSTHKTFFGPQRGVLLGNLPEKLWTRVDRGTFPRATSNHHLHTLPPLLLAALEMQEFGAAYAAAVVKNAQAFAAALHAQGFKPVGGDLGYTRSHQIAVDVRDLGGGSRTADTLEKSDVIVNKNMLPGDDPSTAREPSGLRLGTQEMTRWGMGAEEFRELAALMADCVIRGKKVKTAVRRLRGRFVEVRYSFDSAAVPKKDAQSVHAS